MVNGLFDANLRALGRRTDQGARLLAQMLGAGGPAPDLGLRDRSGTPLPGVVVGGVPRSLVSTFDAQKEASRWAQGWEGGTVVVLGGAGTAAASALEASPLTVWVEPRADVWRSLLTYEDWTGWIGRDEWVPWPGSAGALEAWLLDRYQPLWDGAFRVLEWRGAAGDALWEPYRDATRRALDAMASDFSTQARFGVRWYRNALTNLRRLESASIPPCPGAQVVIAGAGPSLDDALGSDGARRWLEARETTGDRLFATDTALPALLERGVVPDLVLCLDGQLPSYHHFVTPRPRAIPLAADLSSLPLLGRLGMPVVRYLSGHPLGTVVRRFFPEMPFLDGSLGNVSGLARWTALALGARTVETWGVDFAYRHGQAYAHGTYVYDLAGRVQNRLNPLETRLSLSTYAARGRERTASNGVLWDTTPLLRDYRARWEAFSGSPPPTTLAHGAGRWDAFAADWRRRLEALPLPAASHRFSGFVRGLPPETREDWRALGPLALGLHRETGLEGISLLKTVKTKALSFLVD